MRLRRRSQAELDEEAVQAEHDRTATEDHLDELVRHAEQHGLYEATAEPPGGTR